MIKSKFVFNINLSLFERRQSVTPVVDCAKTANIIYLKRTKFSSTAG